MSVTRTALVVVRIINALLRSSDFKPQNKIGMMITGQKF